MNLLIILSAKYLFVVSIVIALFYFLKVDKKIKKELFYLALIALPLSLIIAKVSGYIFYNPRPFVLEHIKPLIAHANDNGFPSDHTLLTMTIASIVFSFNKKLGVVLGLLSVLVGLARVLSQVHHTIDIIGSVVIAIGATYIASLLIAKFLPKIHHK